VFFVRFVVIFFNPIFRGIFLLVKLPDEFNLSFKLYAKPLPYPILDSADQTEDIGSFRIAGVQDKSGMLGADHRSTDAFAL